MRLQTFFDNSIDYRRVEDYLDTKRVVCACKIMKTQPGQSMQAVCDMSGFTNIRAFNRKFKKLVEMTPTEYKKSVIGLANHRFLTYNSSSYFSAIFMNTG